jgi:hypothetical protein
MYQNEKCGVEHRGPVDQAEKERKLQCEMPAIACWMMLATG